MEVLLHLPNSIEIEYDSEDNGDLQEDENYDLESLNTRFGPELEEAINQNASSTNKAFADLNKTSILIDDTLDDSEESPLLDSLNTLSQQSSTYSTSTFSSCFRCAESVKVNSGHIIAPGMHLKFGKYFPIKGIDSIFSSTFGAFGLKQRYVYYHHAIVLEVHETSDMEARVTLLELTKNDQNRFEVIKKERIIDVRKKKTFYVKYNQCRFTPEQIIERANKCIGQSGYDPLNFNCEHVAVWCVSGHSESFMSSDGTDSWLRHRISWVMSIFGKLIQILGKVGGKHIVKFCKFVLASVIFSSVFFLIEFIFSCLRLTELRKQVKDGLICKKCYNEKKLFLVCQIMMSAGALVALLIIHYSSSILFPIVGIVCTVLGVVFLPHLIVLLHKKICSNVNPLYQIPTSVIRRCTDVDKGNILIIPNDHSIIVKDIRVIPRELCHVLHVDIVHFRQRGGFFSKRLVTREPFTVNLTDTYCQVVNFPQDCVLDDQEVVQNAVQKIGEGGHNLFYNRSSHMSRKCKVCMNNWFFSSTCVNQDKIVKTAYRTKEIVYRCDFKINSYYFRFNFVEIKIIHCIKLRQNMGPPDTFFVRMQILIRVIRYKKRSVVPV